MAKHTPTAGEKLAIEAMDNRVTELALGGEIIKAIQLRRYYTNDDLRDARDEVLRRLSSVQKPGADDG